MICVFLHWPHTMLHQGLWRTSFRTDSIVFILTELTLGQGRKEEPCDKLNVCHVPVALRAAVKAKKPFGEAKDLTLQPK